MRSKQRPSKTTRDAVNRGPLGGSAAEAGSEYRSRVSAWFVVHALLASPVDGIALQNAVPIAIDLETDQPVDDIDVTLRGGGHLYVQAKATGSLNHLKDAVAQWVRAAQSLNPQVDRLVVAVGTPSVSVRHLHEALNRRRAPRSGTPSSPEAAAMQWLAKQIGVLSSDKRAAVLDAAVILPLDLLSVSAGHRLAAIAMLEARLIHAGNGLRAFEVLASISRAKAVYRQGGTTEDWLKDLDAAGVPILVDTERGAIGAAALDVAKRKHLGKVTSDGSVIDLRGLALQIPAIQVDQPARWLRFTTGLPDQGRATEATADLWWAARRARRSVLTGLPGSGKSVALRQLAAYWASDPGAPTPFVVSLRRVADAMSRGAPIGEAVVEAALHTVGWDDRPAVRDLLRDGLSTGRIALFFDGLDETRDRRHIVSQQLAAMLRDAHPDVEVVISTRDSACADARLFGYAEFRLLPPADLQVTLDRLCRSLAAIRGVTPAEMNVWIKTRLQWVDELRHKVRGLDETPLIPVLLCALAATRTREALPRSRATAISETVDDAADRLETKQRREGELILGSLEQETAVEAARRAFELIGHLVIQAGSAPEATIEDALTEMGTRDFALPVGRARGAAAALRYFWDEAGMFSSSGSDLLVRARLQLIAEIAEARWVARAKFAVQRDWVREHVHDRQESESAVLAAGLSEAIAAELVKEAVTQSSTDWCLTAVNAIAQGARVTPAALHELVQALLQDLAAAAGDRAVRIAHALTRLTGIEVSDQQAILDMGTSRLPGEHQVLFRAMAAIGWRLAGSEVDELLRELLRSEPPRPEKGYRAMPADEGYGWAVIQAADRLLEGDSDDAALVVDALNRVSNAVAIKLSHLLSQAGHKDAVGEFNASTLASIGGLMASFRQADEGFERLIETVSAWPNASLTFGQRRRLDQFTDFIWTLDIPDHAFDAVADAFFLDGTGFEYILKSVVVLAGFDRGVLAAQTAAARDAFGDRVTHMYEGGAGRELSRWDLVPNKAELRSDLIDLVGSPSRLVSDIAVAAMLLCPERRRAVDELEARLTEWPGRRRFRAALGVAQLSEDGDLQRFQDWAASTDAVLRAASAAVFAQLAATGQQPADIVTASLSDPDDWVRHEASDRLRGSNVHPAAAEVLLRQVSSPDFWTCPHCANKNAMADTVCGSCDRRARWIPTVIS